MSKPHSQLQTRLRLEDAKFFHQQMELNFQDITKFRRFLLAFLAIARSITHVFKAEFHNNKPLMKLYDSKVEEWKDNKIMKFFKEMRNVSLKEHSPPMKASATISFGVDVILVDRVSVKKISPNKTLEQIETPTLEPTEKSKEKIPLPRSEVVSYSFFELPKWFDENPDVMYLCRAYLNILERFVSEAENIIKED